MESSDSEEVEELTVTCPPDCRPGDVIEVEFGGTVVDVTIPDDVGPGDTFEIRLAVDGAGQDEDNTNLDSIGINLSLSSDSSDDDDGDNEEDFAAAYGDMAAMLDGKVPAAAAAEAEAAAAKAAEEAAAKQKAEEDAAGASASAWRAKAEAAAVQAEAAKAEQKAEEEAAATRAKAEAEAAKAAEDAAANQKAEEEAAAARSQAEAEAAATAEEEAAAEQRQSVPQKEEGPESAPEPEPEQPGPKRLEPEAETEPQVKLEPELKEARPGPGPEPKLNAESAEPGVNLEQQPKAMPKIVASPAMAATKKPVIVVRATRSVRAVDVANQPKLFSVGLSLLDDDSRQKKKIAALKKLKAEQQTAPSVDDTATRMETARAKALAEIEEESQKIRADVESQFMAAEQERQNLVAEEERARRAELDPSELAALEEFERKMSRPNTVFDRLHQLHAERLQVRMELERQERQDLNVSSHDVWCPHARPLPAPEKYDVMPARTKEVRHLSIVDSLCEPTH